MDYVVPMVFPDDESWQATFAFVGRRCNKENVRWRSWGTEQQLIKLVKKNMPWVRTIYIILAKESQRQAWMDDEGVRVVYHRDFIPARFLPLFNSRSIEMFLKDIPDLSEQFLYGNDDMYPLSPLKEEDFFVNGQPCIHMTEKAYPETPNNFQIACMGGMNFVAREFGKHYETTWYKNGHGIAPILKSTCEHLWAIGGKDIEASISPFRETFNFNQYIYSWWQFFSGQFLNKPLKHTYTSVKNSVNEVREALEKGGVVCVNDNEAVTDIKPYISVVREMLSRRI